MKKILATLILISSIIICANSQDYVEIIMSKTDTHTRSVVEVPEVTISHEVLFVSFYASGMHDLRIEDSFGGTVYSSALPADGMEYSYDLSGIGEGMFRLVLEGPGGEYEGFSVKKYV